MWWWIGVDENKKHALVVVFSCVMIAYVRSHHKQMPRTRRSTRKSSSTPSPAHSPSPKTTPPKTTPPCGVQVTLRPHQRRVVDRLLAVPSGPFATATPYTTPSSAPLHAAPHRILFVAPTGSGKTIAAIVSGVCLMQRGVVTGMHVVAPKSVVAQFQQEVKRMVPLELQGKIWVTTHATYFRAKASRSRSRSRSRRVHNPPVADPRGKLLVIDEAHALVTSIVEKRRTPSHTPNTHTHKTTPTRPVRRPRRTRRRHGGRSARTRTTSTSTTSTTSTPTRTNPPHRPTFQSGQRAYYAVRAARQAKALLLLTATPLQNSPTDLLNLLCMVLGQTPAQFYTSPEVVAVKQLLQQMQASYIRTANTRVLERLMRRTILYLFLRRVAPLVVFSPATTDGLPTVDTRTVSLKMDAEYLQLYNAVEGDQMNVLRQRLLRNTPTDPPATDPPATSPLECVFNPDAIDAFYLKLRRAVNGVTRNVVSAKVEYAVRIACDGQRLGRRVIIYSSFLNGGLALVKNQLEHHSPTPVPFVEIVGHRSLAERYADAQALNHGKVYVLLLSRAGSEGMDLKGVRDVVLLEPHFHAERMRQVVGRAVRYRSHDALPPKDRNVTVHHLLLSKPNDDSAQWEATERHNESVIHQLLTDHRERAHHGTLRLLMNEAIRLTYDHIRAMVWADTVHGHCGHTHTRPHQAPRDAYDNVPVDTTRVTRHDYSIYVQFTDWMGGDRNGDRSGDRGGDRGGEMDLSSSDSDYTDKTDDSATPNADDNADVTPSSPLNPSNQSHTPPAPPPNAPPHHARYLLRHLLRDTSVDDIIQRMAIRKAALNETFLATLKRLSRGVVT